MTTLTALLAQERTADLLRAARRDALGAEGVATSSRDAADVNEGIVLRLARAQDARTLRILAQLDDARELAGEVLMAVIDGNAVAALSLHDGRVVADPFMPTADAVTLLRVRARHLGRVEPRRHWWRLRPRFA